MREEYEHILRVGAAYKPVKDFTSGRWNFVGDEKLVFAHASYSPYDGCYAYRFTAANEETKIWLLNDALPPETWKEYFEVVSAQGQSAAV